MTDPIHRLIRCFASVFPNSTEEQIRTMSVDNNSEWDSLKSATLVALLEQEFGVVISPVDMIDLDSFDAIDTYLRTQGVLQ